MLECVVTSQEARIRKGPDAFALAVGTFYYGDTVYGTQIVDDTYHPYDENYKWLDLGNNTFVAVVYRGQQQLRIVSESDPSDQIFAIVKDDVEIDGVSRPTRTLGLKKRGWGTSRYVRGLPMVRPYNGVEHSYLDNKMTQFILSHQPFMSVENQRSNMSGLFHPDRAFNNFQAVHFAIENGIVVNKLVTKYYPVLTGRAKLKLLSRVPFRFKGTMSFPFEIIDTSKDYSHFSPQTHPWLFFTPYNSCRAPIFKPNGNWTGRYVENIVEPFHWFESSCVLPIHGRGSNVAYIPANWVRILV